MKQDKVANTNHSGLKDELTSKSKTFGRMVASLILLLLFDLAAIAVCVLAAVYIRSILLPLIPGPFFADKLIANTLQLLWWYPLAFIFSLGYEKLYSKRLPFWVEVEWILRASLLALFIAVAFIYLSGIGSIVSRAVVFMVWLLALFLIPLFRYNGKKFLLKLSVWSRPLILVGDAATAIMITRALEREKTMGYYLLGYINNPDTASPDAQKMNAVCDTPCLGIIDEAEEIISRSPASDIVLALPGLPADDLVEMANRFQPIVDNVMIIPDLFGLSLNGIEIVYFFEEQAIFLQIRNRFRSQFNRSIKRLFDMLFGIFFIILLSPALLLLSLAVVLSSPGSAFYIQERIGQNGKIFYAYKFRTMFLNCDQILNSYLAENTTARLEWEKYKKLKSDDPRVTKVGRLLRRFSLDELPQIFNVLKNEMSLVGPRPYMPRELDDIGSWARDILITKPGLTGLWQVSGRSNLSFKSRLRLDAWYVRNWSLWLDIVLILRTFRVVLKREGAY